MKKEIGRGAEAVIYHTDDKVVKHRLAKTYRIPQIDDRLRKSRTKREAKILGKLRDISFRSPYLISTDSKQDINMEFVEGKKLRDCLDSKNCGELCLELGKQIRVLHDNHIIHGDLTTSNFILGDKDKMIYFIDFGLSFFSFKVEDMAVDLHLLRQALESKHYEFWEKAFEQVLNGYNNKEVEERLEKVELRGRNKGKG